MNDRIDTLPYFMLIPTERRLRTNEFVNSFMDMASAFLPGSKPIADEAYDKNCHASCARVHDAVVACMKNLRSEIDGWLEACEDDKK